MGFFDRFRSKWEREKKDAKKTKHVVSGKERDEEAKHAAFRAVSSGQPAAKKDEKAKRPKKEDTGAAYRILLRPIVTEKSTRLAAQRKYVFEVRTDVNKIEVKRAVHSLYGIRPSKVNLMNYDGKRVRYGRTSGQLKAWKKAIVTLNPGEKIEALEA